VEILVSRISPEQGVFGIGSMIGTICGWLAMANASKQMANTNIRLPRGGRRASVKKEVDEYMDMD